MTNTSDMNWRRRLLFFLFDLLYHSFAWAYDFVAAVVSFNLWKKWVKEVIPYLQGDTILELGFGTGHLLHALSHPGKKIIGVDLSHQMIRLTQERINTSNHTSPFLVRADGRAMPFKESTFDHIVATFPAPYIFEETTLKGAFFALKENGSIIFLLSAIPALPEVLERIHIWLTQGLKIFVTPTDFLEIVQQRVEGCGFQQVNTEWKPCSSGKILVLVAVKSVQTR
ncbi:MULTISPECIES: class I SAM-dependent methyltransferase [Anaerolinea]|uniref:class I SAM-dependent methyltransferase n=1 Tax=Anaerolinea TaxID=233189 RepID=UPI0026F261F7|nr:class I SAM-dependent methyltransferase [Anaerolinea thermophila]